MTVTLCRTAADAWQDGYKAGAASLQLPTPELAQRIAELLARGEQAAPRPLLTVAQAAKQIGVSRTSFYELLHAGEIASVKLPLAASKPAAASSRPRSTGSSSATGSLLARRQEARCDHLGRRPDGRSPVAGEYR
jgi:hypothetical protein